MERKSIWEDCGSNPSCDMNESAENGNFRRWKKNVQENKKYCIYIIICFVPFKKWLLWKVLYFLTLYISTYSVFNDSLVTYFLPPFSSLSPPLLLHSSPLFTTFPLLILYPSLLLSLLSLFLFILLFLVHQPYLCHPFFPLLSYLFLPIFSSSAFFSASSFLYSSSFSSFCAFCTSPSSSPSSSSPPPLHHLSLPPSPPIFITQGNYLHISYLSVFNTTVHVIYSYQSNSDANEKKINFLEDN